jgi:hypothetical protein
LRTGAAPRLSAIARPAIHDDVSTERSRGRHALLGGGSSIRKQRFRGLDPRWIRSCPFGYVWRCAINGLAFRVLRTGPSGWRLRPTPSAPIDDHQPIEMPSATARHQSCLIFRKKLESITSARSEVSARKWSGRRQKLPRGAAVLRR